MADYNLKTPDRPVGLLRAVEKLMYWAQVSLPAVYGEELTYAKEQGKMAAKINEVIEQLNVNTEWTEYLLNEGVENETIAYINELIANGTLGSLINNELLGDIQNNLNTQFKQFEDYIDLKLQGIVSGGPQGTANSIAEIPPTADKTRPYLITGGDLKGHWVYWNGTAWVDGGVYQAASLQPNSITLDRLKMNELNNNSIVHGTVSENLVNPNTLIMGEFISNASGNIINNANMCRTPFIELDMERPILIKNTGEQGAFYDENFQYISGYILPSEVNNKVPPGKYLRASAKITEINKFEILNRELPFNNYKFKSYANNEFLIFYENHYKITPLFNVGQLFNGVTFNNNVFTIPAGASPNGSYVVFNTNSGNLIYHVKIKSNSKLALSELKLTTPMQIIDAYISPYTSENGYYIYDYYVNFSEVSDNNRVTVQLGAPNGPSWGSNITTLEIVEAHIVYKDNGADMGEYLSKLGYSITNIIEVGAGKKFTKLVDAVNSITDSSIGNKYQINIFSGTYDILQEMGGDAYLNIVENQGGIGLLLPDYVSLNGVEDDVKLVFNIPDEKVTLKNSTQISVLNFNKNNNINNLFIEAYNVRYCVHDETGSSIKNCEQNISNCTFNHLGYDKTKTPVTEIWPYTSAFGAGSNSGMKYKIYNCKFYGFENPGFGMHDNANITDSIYLEFNNCLFSLNDVLNNSSYCFRLSSAFDGTGDNICVVNNCSFGGFALLSIEAGAQTISWSVIGGGNGSVLCNIADNNYRRWLMYDEIKEVLTNDALQSGKSVVLNNNKCSILSNGEWPIYGISLGNYSVGGKAIIKTNGYIPGNIIGVTATKYQYVSLNTDGTFKIGTDNIVGFCDNDINFIKLINKFY